MKKFIASFLFCLLTGSIWGQQISMLKEIRWERSDNRLVIHFTFDQSPDLYPSFYRDNLKAFTIDFAGTRLSSSAEVAGRAPFPLSGFSMSENPLDDSTTIVRATALFRNLLPVLVKRDNAIISLEFDLTPLFSKQIKLFSGASDALSGNGLSAVSLQMARDTLEILFSCVTAAPEIFPVWISTDKKRVVADLEGVPVSSDIGGFEKSEPLKAVALVKGDGMSRWVFDFTSPVSSLSTEMQGKSISVFAVIPAGKSGKFKPKKWMYWSAAGAAVLTTGVILMSGGSAKKPPPSGGGPGTTPDDWNDQPPLPDK